MILTENSFLFRTKTFNGELEIAAIVVESSFKKEYLQFTKILTEYSEFGYMSSHAHFRNSQINSAV